MAVASGFSGVGSSAIRTGENGGLAELGLWLSRRPADPSELVNAGLEALDWLNLGVALTDRTGQLLLANRTAEQLLASRDGLELIPGGTIGTVNGSCGQALRAAIEQAAREVVPGAASASAAVVVPRLSGKRPLTLFVRPVQGQSQAVGSSRTALIFMLDPEGPVEASEAGLRQLYGFTSTEARLAKLLISGSPFERCCADLRVRPSTARMHLANLFAKTGVQRQGQLISVLLKSVGMVRMANADGTNEAGPREFVAGVGRQKCSSPDILAGGLEALDSLHIGVAVTNGLRQVLFANATAHQILAARDGLEISAQGVLDGLKKNFMAGASARTPSESDLSAKSTPPVSVVALPRAAGKRPLTLVVRPLDGKEACANLRGPSFLIFMLDPELPIPAVEPGLRQLYGFTSCEARLAHLLMEGHTLEDCCEQMEIRPSTARMHLANMFGKAGVQRQGALISLLLKSVGLVRLKSDDGTMRRAEWRGTPGGFPPTGTQPTARQSSSSLPVSTNKEEAKIGVRRWLRSDRCE